MIIHKNVPIPPLNSRARLCYEQNELYRSIISDQLEVGDMVEMRNDCATIRQKLYDTQFRIAVRFNTRNGKYNVWRTK